MHRLYCSTLVAALLLGASLIADAGASVQSLAGRAAAPTATVIDRDGYMLITTDAAGEVTVIDLVSVH